MSLKNQFVGYDPLSVGHFTAVHNTGAMSTGHDTGTVTLFTITGLVRLQVVAHITTAVTSASDLGTLEVGVAGGTARLLGQELVDATAFAVGDVWTEDVDPETSIAQLGDAANGLEWKAASSTNPIILTIVTQNMTAGVIDFYCLWTPISAGGGVYPA